VSGARRPADPEELYRSFERNSLLFVMVIKRPLGALNAYNCASFHLRKTVMMRVLAPALMFQLYSPLLAAARVEA
jgi:hypothetical protein